MVKDLVAHACGALTGLAVGDALGNPTEGRSPEAIRKQWGRVLDFLSPEQTGSDDTDYALFSANLLLQHGDALTPALAEQAWHEQIISSSNEYKGAGFSEILTIANLRRGLRPPASGRHLHSWSDGLAMRAAPHGIFAAGDPARAAHLAEMEGCVSHAGEGLHAGRAVAAAVAMAMTGAELPDIFAAARAVIPADSWTARALATGIAIGMASPTVWQALEPLHTALVCTCYPWADLAPEAVGLAFGVVAAARGEFESAVLGGVNVGRDTDTIAALAGAITGANHGWHTIPAKWRERVSHAQGACIKTVAGQSLLATAEALARLVPSGRSGT